MKKTISLFVFALLCSATLFGQWQLIKSSQTRFSGLALQGADRVTAITYNDVFRSTDGGQNWTVIPVDTQFLGFMYDIEFPTNAVGYICGGYDVFGQPNNEILKSSDGGQSWQLLSHSPINSVYLIQLDFLNADTGFFVGNNGRLFRTLDGANTLMEISLPDSQVFAQTVYAQSAENIVVGTVKTTTDGSGSYFYEIGIFRSVDLGQQWTKVYEDTLTTNSSWDYSPIIYNFFFRDVQNGYAVGRENRFLITHDGGQTWHPVTVQPHVLDISEVVFTDAQTGYINNFDKIQKTTDGGTSWTQQSLPHSLAGISNLVFANTQVGYCIGISDLFVGDAGFIFKTTNGGDSATRVATILPESSISIFPNPAKDLIHLQYNNLHIQSLQLTDLSGRLIKTFPAESKMLNVSGVATGLYFLQVKAKEGTVAKKVEIR